ncbi:MAG: chromate efflux transporter [Shewanella sp.]|nr:chromate efflux transporter [Shewanella sp.]MCF1432048.1 chromate efflux transporter [Shewanella sp.]MCF1438890.1 chromate efflux transporter [Shewanella sp.]MCF1459245.1 chromate efflux transporter [Shewanella sp.]
MIWQIFVRFFTLGLISFGGPAAHIGYFRQTFVCQLNWLDDRRYGNIVALSQFLPGPGSSQVGFAIGYQRGGIFGALAAFIGFTLPSFLLLYLMAVTSNIWLDNDLFQGVIHGLKLLAVVVVADAVLGMFRQFCQKKAAKGIMLLSTVLLLLVSGIEAQIALIGLSALLGYVFLTQDDDGQTVHEDTSIRWVYLLSFVILLAGASAMAGNDTLVGVAGQFYQAGSLVFGGGHVVLPLLESTVGGNMSPDQFLAGYSLAQAVPGPMFTLATYMGAEVWLANPFMGALVATLAIFLPGFLLMLAFIHSWHGLSQRPQVAGIVTGINAGVVGLLFTALYNPVFVSSVQNATDIALVVAGFGLSKLMRLHIVLLVAGFAGSGMLLALV